MEAKLRTVDPERLIRLVSSWLHTFLQRVDTCSALNSVLEIWLSIAPHHADLTTYVPYTVPKTNVASPTLKILKKEE